MQQPIYTHKTSYSTHQLPVQQLPVHSWHQGGKVLCTRSTNQGLARRRLDNTYSPCIQIFAARKVACKGSSTPLSEQSNDDTAEVPANQQGFRHAIVHDFCMSIPFGSIVLAAGIVSLLFGSGRQGLAFALAGIGILVAAFFSLVQWRAQRPSTAFTLVSAGITAAVQWGFWDLVKAGIATIPNTVMFALSLAMLTFLIYNIVAGGNPPKKTTAEDDQELAAAAAAAT